MTARERLLAVLSPEVVAAIEPLIDERAGHTELDDIASPLRQFIADRRRTRRGWERRKR